MKTPIEYIKEAIQIYLEKENFIFFARIMAVLVIVTTVLGYIYSYFYPIESLEQVDYENTGLLIGLLVSSLLLALVGLWTQTTTYFAIFNIGSSEKEVFKMGYKNMWMFLAISFVLGVIILLGLVLLIIPAVIFGVWYSFSLYLVLEKKLGIREALKQSKEIVKGRFFKILGRSLVFGLFSFLVTLLFSLVPTVGSILISFIAPLFLLPSYLLYKDLTISS